MRDDPIVEETRRIRDELTAKFNYDVTAINDQASSGACSPFRLRRER
jgi:hypothetical protein